MQVPDWLMRERAIRELVRSHGLSDPRTRSAVIAALNTESNEPDWGELDEGLPYEAYEWLTEAVEKIATEYRDSSAWRALVFSNYDDEYSPFAGWLVRQPESLPLFFEMLHSKFVDERGKALVLLARALGSCEAEPSDACSATLAKRDLIRSLVRSGLHSENDTSAIEAESLCGNRDDLKLLDELLSQAHPAGVNTNSPSEMEAFHFNLRHAEREINERLQKAQK